jgi:hypothetical protein
MPSEEDGSSACTIVLTTSPVPHNPDTGMLETTMRSMALAHGLSRCRKVIVCDGHTVKTRDRGRKAKQSYRQGAPSVFSF